MCVDGFTFLTVNTHLHKENRERENKKWRPLGEVAVSNNNNNNNNNNNRNNNRPRNINKRFWI